MASNSTEPKLIDLDEMCIKIMLELYSYYKIDEQLNLKTTCIL